MGCFGCKTNARYSYAVPEKFGSNVAAAERSLRFNAGINGTSRGSSRLQGRILDTVEYLDPLVQLNVIVDLTRDGQRTSPELDTSKAISAVRPARRGGAEQRGLRPGAGRVGRTDP